jgi:hypothetical protein
MENDREILIPFRIDDDFHKLLFAQAHIKSQDKIISELRIEIGMLKSEIDEIIDTQHLAKLNRVLKNNLRGVEKRNRALQSEITRLKGELKKKNEQK